MKKLYVLFSLIMIICFYSNISYAQPRTDYGDPKGVFDTPKGVKIISYVDKWSNHSQLEEIYNDFSKNFMSDEIDYLKAIYIYPDTPEGVAGLYHPNIQPLLDGGYEYTKDSYIEIFNASSYNNVSEISRVLTHEYGHHFTTYHLVTGENKYFSEWRESEFSKYRNLRNNSKVKYFSQSNDKYEHRWDVMEIAAEDYVQLFGSPLAKKSEDFLDLKDRADRGIMEYTYTSGIFNLLPQENLDIILATEANGLREYWLKLAGYNLKKNLIPKKPQLKLLEEKVLYKKYKQLVISWDDIPDNREYEYTLVMYKPGENSFPIPIKTAKTGESLKAYMGCYIKELSSGDLRILMDNYSGKYLVRLFIKNKDGFLYSTPEYEINIVKDINSVSTFNLKGKNIDNDTSVKPIVPDKEPINTHNTNMRFRDIDYNHWAYSYVIKLSNKNIIDGYEDKTFRPDNKIKKSEFIALVLRILDIDLTDYEMDSDHWFISSGYLNACKDIGLIKEQDYGRNYTKFNCDDNITREEMMFIVSRAIQYLKLPVNDVKNYSEFFDDANSIKYKNDLNIAVHYGIIKGYPDGTFRPKNNATRAEASKLIYTLDTIIGF